MRREAGAHEHLDGALLDRAALAGSLRDLRRINRRFGGARLSVRALRRLLELSSASHPLGETISILDVGTGAADVPVAFLGARGPWRRLAVTAVDSRPEVIEAALAISPALATLPGLSLAVADGLALPYPDGSFDVAHASLVLHHHEPPSAVLLLAELRRVARRGVIVNDLSRGWLPWLGARLVLPAMSRNPFTLHDGPLSVRRAYTRAEARRLLAEAGLRATCEVVGLLAHRWAIGAVAR